MAVTAVQDRLVLDTAEVKTLLGITVPDFDALIDLYLAAGKEAADCFMINPFLKLRTDAYQIAVWGDDEACTDIVKSDVLIGCGECERVTLYADPVVELPIPTAVKIGVLEYVRWNLNNVTRDPALLRERVGEIQRDYAKYATVDDLLKDIQTTFWRKYRLPPGSARPEGYY